MHTWQATTASHIILLVLFALQHCFPTSDARQAHTHKTHEKCLPGYDHALETEPCSKQGQADAALLEVCMLRVALSLMEEGSHRQTIGKARS